MPDVEQDAVVIRVPTQNISIEPIPDAKPDVRERQSRWSSYSSELSLEGNRRC
jgi:hypothetical protein